MKPRGSILNLRGFSLEGQMIVKLIAAITVSILLIAFGVKSIFAILVAQVAITLLISILEQNSIDNQLDKNCAEFKKDLRKFYSH